MQTLPPSSDTQPVKISSTKKETSRTTLWALVFLIITALNGYLMVRDRVPILGLVLLGVSFLIAFIFAKERTLASPLTPFIVVLILLLPLSLSLSIDSTLSLPKIYALVLAIALFFVMLNAIRTQAALLLVTFALVLLAVLTALLGLFGANWLDASFGFLAPVFTRLPSLSDFLPGLVSGPVVNVNAIGGALALFLPFLVSLVWDANAFSHTYFAKDNIPRLSSRIYKILVWCVLLLVGLVLFFTNSRGTWLGCAVGVFLLAVLKDRRFLWLLLVVFVLFLIVLFAFADGDLQTLITLLDTTEEAQTLQGRWQAWSATLYMIQDFPVTGSGIGTYTRVFNDLYALNAFLSGTMPALHAHNTFLSVAVDLGMPALVLYTALLGGFAAMLVRAYRKAAAHIKVLILGLGAGMLAHQVFGVMDAFVLGTKLGIIFWIYLGLVAVLYKHFLNDASQGIPKTAETKIKTNRKSQNSDIQSRRFFSRAYPIIISLLGWLFVSLIVLSFANINIYLSFVLCLMGGFVLGAVVVMQQKRRAE